MTKRCKEWRKTGVALAPTGRRYCNRPAYHRGPHRACGLEWDVDQTKRRAEGQDGGQVTHYKRTDGVPPESELPRVCEWKYESTSLGRYYVGTCGYRGWNEPREPCPVCGKPVQLAGWGSVQIGGGS